MVRKQQVRSAILALLLCTLSIWPIFSANAQSNNPEIFWDRWGVPHIFAANDVGLFYGLGWAQAHNHAGVILGLYGQARGRAAEYWGADYIDSDKQVHTVDLAAQAEDAYARLSPEWRQNIDAFTAGINDYTVANPDKIDKKWQVVLPLRSVDVIAHGIRSLRYVFVARAAFSAAQQWEKATTTWNPEPTEGSNAWAIAPSYNADGHAILVANPHQPWYGLGMWMEAHLVSPTMNLYGALIVGNPVLGVGFNENLGWTHTVNTHDGWDLYKLSLTPNGYRFDGQDKAFETREEKIRVLQPDGTYKDIVWTVKIAVQGPVIAQRGGSEALALRVVAEHATDATIQWWEMGKAKNLNEFEAALKPLRIPMFTVMYADKAGNIMHVFNEQVPIRSEGDWSFWNNTTPVDGSHPALIPGDSSKYVWTAYHPYADLPKVINPASGWLQNANEAPWTTTIPAPLKASDYPAYMMPPPFVWPRPQSSMRLLYEHKGMSFDDVLMLKQSTFAELTNQVLDDLIKAANASPDQTAQKAAVILAKWDRHADADSVGAALFTAWALDFPQRNGPRIFATQWNITDPLNTPHGLADPDAAVQSLIRVANQLELTRAIGGGMDVAYGNAFRLRVGKYDLPASGGFDVLGTFRTLTFMQDKDLRFKAVAGDSFIAVVEFSQPLRAKVLLTHGNATQPDSPHFGDQLELFAKKEYRDVWLTRASIEANLEQRETLNPATVPAR
jgi:acyl-homoserine-lactone acylase